MCHARRAETRPQPCCIQHRALPRRRDEMAFRKELVRLMPGRQVIDRIGPRKEVELRPCWINLLQFVNRIDGVRRPLAPQLDVRDAEMRIRADRELRHEQAVTRGRHALVQLMRRRGRRDEEHRREPHGIAHGFRRDEMPGVDGVERAAHNADFMALCHSVSLFRQLRSQ